MVKRHTYDYNGEEIEPGTGTMYVKTDGAIPHFKGSKAERSYFLGRETRDLEWAEAGRRASGKAGDNQMSDAEHTFAVVKPDGVQRDLTGDIVSRFEDRGLEMVAGRFMQIDEELVHGHYGEHEGKLFFEGLVGFITPDPVFAMVWEGQGATRQVRYMMGEADPAESTPGAIRGDYGLNLGRSVIHGSDHEDEGASEREIALFFDEDRLVDYERVDET